MLTVILLVLVLLRLLAAVLVLEEKEESPNSKTSSRKNSNSVSRSTIAPDLASIWGKPLLTLHWTELAGAA